MNAGSGDAEGEKRVASMLKHFRGLVDETAAKSRFLSAFHRKRVFHVRYASPRPITLPCSS